MKRAMTDFGWENRRTAGGNAPGLAFASGESQGVPAK
jgi:hypothetical protein